MIFPLLFITQGFKHFEHVDRALQTSCYPTASKIKLSSTTGEPLQLFAFVAEDPNGADLTTGKTATQTSTLKNNIDRFGPANAVDGDPDSFMNTDSGDVDPNPVWTVELGLNNEVSLVTISNRYCGDITDASNCLGRLSNAIVELLDSEDTVVGSQSFGDTTGDLNLSLDFSTCVSRFNVPLDTILCTNANLILSLFMTNTIYVASHSLAYS